MVKRSFTHIAYLVAIAIKGLDGALELLLGCLIAIAGRNRLYALVIRVTAPELDLHPQSHAVHLMRRGASALAEAHGHFVLIYLFVHGALKFAVAVCLIGGGTKWIFPVASLVLAAFIAYMSYRLTLYWSGWLLGFALFDLLTLALVLNEWRRNPFI